MVPLLTTHTLKRKVGFSVFHFRVLQSLVASYVVIIMGTTGSKGQSPVGIFIEVDRRSLYPNESITGKVHYKVFRTCKGTPVTLKLTGFEETKWRNRVHYNGICGTECAAVTHSENYGGKHIFFEEYFRVNEEEHHRGTLEAGSYTVPFEIQLPTWLPGSTVFGVVPPEDEDTAEFYFGQIRYKIAAVSTIYGKGNSDFSGTAKCSQNFNIMTAPPPPTACITDVQGSINVCRNLCNVYTTEIRYLRGS